MQALQEGAALTGEVVGLLHQGGVGVGPPLLGSRHKAPLLQAGEELQQRGGLPALVQLLGDVPGVGGVVPQGPQGFHHLQLCVGETGVGRFHIASLLWVYLDSCLFLYFTVV